MLLARHKVTGFSVSFCLPSFTISSQFPKIVVILVTHDHITHLISSSLARLTRFVCSESRSDIGQICCLQTVSLDAVHCTYPTIPFCINNLARHSAASSPHRCDHNPYLIQCLVIQISPTIVLALPLILTSPVCGCAVGAFLAQFPPFINVFSGLPDNLHSNVVLVFAGCPQLTVATGA